jgi:hypothetical protein
VIDDGVVEDACASVVAAVLFGTVGAEISTTPQIIDVIVLDSAADVDFKSALDFRDVDVVATQDAAACVAVPRIDNPTVFDHGEEGPSRHARVGSQLYAAASARGSELLLSEASVLDGLAREVPALTSDVSRTQACRATIVVRWSTSEFSVQARKEPGC